MGFNSDAPAKREAQAIQRLTRANNLIFVAALLLSQVFSWALLFALLF